MCLQRLLWKLTVILKFAVPFSSFLVCECKEDIWHILTQVKFINLRNLRATCKYSCYTAIPCDYRLPSSSCSCLSGRKALSPSTSAPLFSCFSKGHLPQVFCQQLIREQHLAHQRLVSASRIVSPLLRCMHVLGTGMGGRNINASHLLIPRLTLISSLSSVLVSC